jgi:protein TonB
MDPRLWALLPLVALLILGAYFLGKHFNQPEPVVAQQVPVVQAPAPSPTGKMLVTEVPRALTVTPVVPNTQPNAGKPAAGTSFKREEPVVDLPTPSDAGTSDTNTDAGADETDKGAQTTHSAAASSEPDREPEKINDPALEYPSSAYEEGKQGNARVSLTVTSTGGVEDVRIDESSGDSRLDQAALDYVQRLKFRPAMREGKAVPLRITRNVPFSLK